MNILPGRASNQTEVVRYLKERGFYSSGIPRTGCDAAVRNPVPFRFLSSKQLRYLSPEDFQAYIDHARREEGNNPHG
jgi:hypothetical protein